MSKTSFTTRIDTELKAKLEDIARQEERSASYMANQAIQALVEDREYTQRLIDIGLQEIAAGNTISEERMDDWVNSWSEGEERPFPAATNSSDS